MKYGISVLLLLLCFACGEEKATLQPLNLLKYGVPLSINAPDSAKVKTSDMGIFKDISITSGEDFAVQIFLSKATTVDIAQIKASQMESVKRAPYFSKVVREEDKGFIYENLIDSTSNFGFRYIQVMGDQEVIFQPGMGSLFSLEETENMYKAIQQK